MGFLVMTFFAYLVLGAGIVMNDHRTGTQRVLPLVVAVGIAWYVASDGAWQPWSRVLIMVVGGVVDLVVGAIWIACNCAW